MEITCFCDNCGYINKVETDGSKGVAIKTIDWEKYLNPDLVTKLSNYIKDFDKDGQKLLYISGIYRRSFFPALDKAIPQDDLPKAIEKFYFDEIVPILNKINENFEIIGCLTPPSALRLAVVDLNMPWAVFCFPVVKDTPELQGKLEDLGLGTLTLEGVCATVGPGSPLKTSIS